MYMYTRHGHTWWIFLEHSFEKIFNVNITKKLFLRKRPVDFPETEGKDRGPDVASSEGHMLLDDPMEAEEK
jgi:hypothetical protein